MWTFSIAAGCSSGVKNVQMAGGLTAGGWTAVHCVAIVRATIRILGALGAGTISTTLRERSHLGSMWVRLLGEVIG